MVVSRYRQNLRISVSPTKIYVNRRSVNIPLHLIYLPDTGIIHNPAYYFNEKRIKTLGWKQWIYC